jgi:thymidylate synthase (FAD)
MEVHLIDKMGSDLSVVNSARVSFSKESKLVDSDEESPESEAWYGMTGQKLYKQVLSARDQKLIRTLASEGHWTPFSHVQITMREKVPIFVARQRFKHMVGFTYNEVSRRYVDGAPEFFVPDAWRGRPTDNKKQGSSDEVIDFSGDAYIYMDEDGPKPFMGYKQYLKIAEAIYNGMIKKGIAPEQARMVLPQSMYTTYYVTGSLAAWARAYKLRSDSHAQKEIQDLAKMWQDVIGSMEDLKHSWQALTI